MALLIIDCSVVAVIPGTLGYCVQLLLFGCCCYCYLFVTIGCCCYCIMFYLTLCHLMALWKLRLLSMIVCVVDYVALVFCNVVTLLVTLLLVPIICC